MLRSAISAFTRVFDALWRCAADPGSIVLPHRLGSRLCGASSGRCFASPGERCTASGTRDLLLHTPSSETLVARSAARRVSNHVAVGCAAMMLWHSGLVVVGFRAPIELDGHALDEAVRRFLKFSPFLCFRQPVFHLFPSKRSPLTAHVFQRSKLIFRIHKFPQHLFSLTWSNLHLMKCQLTIS